MILTQIKGIRMKKIINTAVLTTFCFLANSAFADELLINQDVTFEEAEMEQGDGSNNTQAMNLVQKDSDTAIIRQDVDGDELTMTQDDGTNNLQAVNLVETDEESGSGVIWQDTNVDEIQMEQTNGSGNTQAINAVISK